MVFFYRLGLFVFDVLIQFVALFDDKAKKWIKGREGIFDKIAKEVNANEKHTWFHFPSLGEFEQGRTVLERYRDEWPNRKILITFFSPSGYEVRKKYPLADYVYYLPSDSPSNAKRFIELINPDYVFFIKYDYWYYYFKELNQRNIPLYMVSSIFRANQIFFKFYGNFFRKTLRYVTYFFVQNEKSIALLSGVGIKNASIVGDTRFDRVMQVVNNAQDLPLIASFLDGKDTLVAGSTWPPDLEMLEAFHQTHKRWRIVIAPHDINAQSIKNTLTKFPGALLYSQLKEGEVVLQKGGKQSKVLIIDNVGMLSSLYRYGDVTYIGGGFGKGIHNTLEAAAYGRPVIFGPRYEKFQEAKDLIKVVAAFPIKDAKEFIFVMERLMDEDFRINVDGAAKEYVYFNAGATERIIAYLKR